MSGALDISAVSLHMMAPGELPSRRVGKPNLFEGCSYDQVLEFVQSSTPTGSPRTDKDMADYVSNMELSSTNGHFTDSHAALNGRRIGVSYDPETSQRMREALLNDDGAAR